MCAMDVMIAAAMESGFPTAGLVPTNGSSDTERRTNLFVTEMRNAFVSLLRNFAAITLPMFFRISVLLIPPAESQPLMLFRLSGFWTRLLASVSCLGLVDQMA